MNLTLLTMLDKNERCPITIIIMIINIGKQKILTETCFRRTILFQIK